MQAPQVLLGFSETLMHASPQQVNLEDVRCGVFDTCLVKTHASCTVHPTAPEVLQIPSTPRHVSRELLVSKQVFRENKEESGVKRTV